MEKPVVAIDIDEVLAGFLPSLIEYHNEKFSTKYVLSDFHSYRFCEVWGGSDQEAVDLCHEFFESEKFAELPPIRGARQVLEFHSKYFDFVCVTSRQHIIVRETEVWVNRHFPGIFKAIHHGNHWSKDSPNPGDALTNKAKTIKPEMCLAVNAVALVDDSLSYAHQCSHEERLVRKGFKVAVFGEYRWNNGSLPEIAKRTKDWNDVHEFLLNLNKELELMKKSRRMWMVASLTVLLMLASAKFSRIGR